MIALSRTLATHARRGVPDHDVPGFVRLWLACDGRQVEPLDAWTERMARVLRRDVLEVAEPCRRAWEASEAAEARGREGMRR
jgi:hypothetical protein